MGGSTRLVVGVCAAVLAGAPLLWAQEQIPQALWNRVHTKAITGDQVLVKGVILSLRNLDCPDVNTEKGLRAKALLNTFLRRGGVFSCSYVSSADGVYLARCLVADRKGLKGKDIAQGMRDSGLCGWRADSDAEGA